MADCPRCLLNTAWCECGMDPSVLLERIYALRAQLDTTILRALRAEKRIREIAEVPCVKHPIHAQDPDPCSPADRCTYCRCLAFVQSFLTPSGEAAEQAGDVADDPREGKAGDAPPTTAGEVSASVDRALSCTSAPGCVCPCCYPAQGRA